MCPNNTAVTLKPLTFTHEECLSVRLSVFLKGFFACLLTTFPLSPFLPFLLPFLSVSPQCLSPSLSLSLCLRHPLPSFSPSFVSRYQLIASLPPILSPSSPPSLPSFLPSIIRIYISINCPYPSLFASLIPFLPSFLPSIIRIYISINCHTSPPPPPLSPTATAYHDKHLGLRHARRRKCDPSGGYEDTKATTAEDTKDRHNARQETGLGYLARIQGKDIRGYKGRILG